MDSGTGTRYQWKITALVVLLPLLIAVYGGWQWYRASASERDLASVQASIAQVEAIQKKSASPSTVTLRRNDGTPIFASQVLFDLRKEEQRLKRGSFVDVLEQGFAALTIGCALAAALAGGLGLLTIRRSGERALHSRDALLREFQQGLKKLPWLIGAVGVLIAAALALGMCYELVAFINSGARGNGSGKIVIAGIVGICCLIAFAFKLLRNMYQNSKAIFERDSMCLMGKSVTEAEAPLVWAFVRSVAEKAKAAMPDAVVLGLDEGFFVTEHPIEFTSGGAAPSGRVLYLPLPYMAYMSKDQAAAVIGHELGHFTGADTEYSLRFSPIYAGAVNSLRAVHHAADAEKGDLMGIVAKPALMLGEFYLNAFDLAVQHWSREREFAADKTGASAGGAQAIASSLLRISVLAPHVGQALEECWTKGGRLEGGVLARVRQLVHEKGLADPAEHLESTQAHPTDSHPTTRSRLEAVNVAPDAALLAAVRNPEESALLRELGLEDGAAGEVPCDADTANAGAAGHAVARAGISAVLEQEFSQAAQERSDEISGMLREIATLGTNRWDAFESGIALSVMCGTFFFISGSAVVSLFVREEPLVAMAPLAVAALFAWLIARIFRRRNKAVMTLTATGVLLGEPRQELPWSAVDDYGITVNSYNGFPTTVGIRLVLAEGCEPPVLSGDSRVRYKAKQRTIFITVTTLRRSTNEDKLSEEMSNHWRGAAAREQLEAMR